MNTSQILWQFYINKPFFNNDGAIINFCDSNSRILFKFKEKITGQIGAYGTKDFETMVSLKYLSNFWITPVIPLINCEINLILTWSENCVALCYTTAN